MTATPSGASGMGTSQRWIKKRSPGIHSNVTRAPLSIGDVPLKVGTISHSPTSGLNASRELSLLFCAVIALLLLATARRAIAREASSSSA